jgi:fucose permease
MTSTYIRNRQTWLLYLSLAMYAYFLNGLGPATPYLKDELHLSYTVGSLHFTAFALGMILAGLSGHWIIARLGRGKALWLGLLGLVAGGIGLALGRTPVLTIAASLLMGAVGSLVLAVVPSGLSDQYGEMRAVALSEANVIASLVSMLPPLLVGWFSQTVLGWRLALWLTILIVLGMRLGLGGVALPEQKAHLDETQSKQRLPGRFWLYWVVQVLAVSVEFCMVSWSVDFVEKSLGLPRAEAAQTLSLFLGGMIVGRLAASRVVQRFSVLRVIFASLMVAGVGFFFFWTASSVWLGLAGLLLTGLGVAPLYPLILSLALGASGGNTTAASARTTLASGVAIFALPLILGRLADSLGIHTAYLVVPVLVLGIFVILLASARPPR